MAQALLPAQPSLPVSPQSCTGPVTSPQSSAALPSGTTASPSASLLAAREMLLGIS